MTEANLFSIFKEAFYKRLMEKTSWGRNDLKKMFLECLNDVLISNLPKDLPEYREF